MVYKTTVSVKRREDVDIRPTGIIKKEKIQQHKNIITLGKGSSASEYGVVAEWAIKGKLRLLQQRHCSFACQRGNGRFLQTDLCLDTKQRDPERDPVSRKGLSYKDSNYTGSLESKEHSRTHSWKSRN